VTTAVKKKPKRRKRSIEQQVAFAIGHSLRVKILIVLNEGVYSAGEVADILDEPLNKVSNHMVELAEGGSIEVVRTRQRRNTTQRFYQATQVPHFTKEEVEDMTVYEAQVTAGIIIQTLFAETMASFEAEKMNNDPGVCLVWNRFNLDAQGRKEVAEEQDVMWDRLTELAEASEKRAEATGAKTTTYVTGSLGFERARKAPQPTRSDIRD
jgi:DNA-binding transcriptional ArsR family regulator